MDSRALSTGSRFRVSVSQAAAYPTGSTILQAASRFVPHWFRHLSDFFLSPWTTKALQFYEDSSHEIYSFDYFP